MHKYSIERFKQIFSSNAKFAAMLVTLCSCTIQDFSFGESKSSSLFAWASDLGNRAPSSTNGPNLKLSLSTSGYPMALSYVAVEDKLNLQTILEKNHEIRLGTGDYRSGGLVSLRIHAGDKIYGILGTQIPNLIISAGAKNVVLSNLTPYTVQFESGEKIEENLFLQVYADAFGTNVDVENNLFVGWTGAINFDNSESGSLKNNRFIRTVIQTSTTPNLRLTGNLKSPSQDNLFLSFNFLTPHGNVSDLQGLHDVSFVGVDAESWNFFNLGTEAAFKVASTVDFLRLMTTNGGDNVHSANDPNGTPYFDIAAKNFLLINDIASTPHIPKTHIRDTVNTAAMLNSPEASKLGCALQQDSQASFLYLAPTPLTAPSLASADQARLHALMIESSKQRSPAWEAPSFEVPADPAGEQWNLNLASQPDATDSLQAQIDAQGVALLPPGKFYISRSLKLKRGQGLIGAGFGKTVIIAKNPSIDMVIGDEHYPNTYSISRFVLSDLTLQGGTNGIHHNAAGSGAGAQYNNIMLSHVSFRNMSNAGIFIDSIYAWDNNLIDHVNFINCGVGLLQRVDPAYQGGDTPGITFMDKNTFYHNQFLGNGIAVSMMAYRANNLDVWVDNLFKDNLRGAIVTGNTLSAVIANSDFINNGGNGVITNDGNEMTVVNSRFRADSSGVQMLNGSFVSEGTSFNQGNGTASVLGSSGTHVTSFYNSTANDISMGKISSGFLFNNYFKLNSELNYEGLKIDSSASSFVFSNKTTESSHTQFLCGLPLDIQY